MIYNWPQARLLRTLAVIAVLIITADLGWSAYGYISSSIEQSSSADGLQTATAVSAGLYSLLALVAGVGGLLAVLVIPRSAQYLIEVEQEVRKVTWPDRPTVIRSTIVITIMTVILALFIFGVDLINQAVVHDLIYGL